MIATLASTQICGVESLMGNRYWSAHYNAVNYNDIIILCPTPPALFAASNDGRNVVITNVSIVHIGTIGVKYWLDTYPGVGLTIQHDNHTTAYATDVFEYRSLEQFWMPNNIATGGNIAAVNPSGHVATDDIFVKIWGRIENTKSVGGITPVSLEGYKWPLTRR